MLQLRFNKFFMNWKKYVHTYECIHDDDIYRIAMLQETSKNIRYSFKVNW